MDVSITIIPQRQMPKWKIITGTTSNTAGATTTAAHNLTASTIVGFVCKVGVNSGYLPNTSNTTDIAEYACWHNSTDFNIRTTATNSTNVLNKAFSIVVFYQ